MCTPLWADPPPRCTALAMEAPTRLCSACWRRSETRATSPSSSRTSRTARCALWALDTVSTRTTTPVPASSVEWPRRSSPSWAANRSLKWPSRWRSTPCRTRTSSNASSTPTSTSTLASSTRPWDSPLTSSRCCSPSPEPLDGSPTGLSSWMTPRTLSCALARSTSALASGITCPWSRGARWLRSLSRAQRVPKRADATLLPAALKRALSCIPSCVC
mmetsp:Transcript_4388/g.9482  ORF Transcript_4388/g.9482 Transcript_4388/m.9482 type:complete len:217 (-) Transcript_4388:5-655(-)